MLDRTFRRFLVAALAFPLASALLASARPACAQVEPTSVVTEPETPSEQPSAAKRSEPAERRERSTPSESYWYGWQTIAADGASLAIFGLGAGTGASVVSWAGAFGVLFGAPAVHVANGRGDIGVLSLAMRVALPLVGAGIGYAAAGTCHDDPNSHELFGNCFLHGFSEAGTGALIGLGSAMILDATALSYGHREITTPRESGALRVTAVAPSYDPVTRTTSIGMGGRF